MLKELAVGSITDKEKLRELLGAFLSTPGLSLAQAHVPKKAPTTNPTTPGGDI